MSGSMGTTEIINIDGQPQSQAAIFKEFVDLLERQIKVYRLLLETVRKEHDLLIAVDIENLNENNKAKEAAARKLRSLEHERVRVAKVLCREISLPGDSIRLLDLAAHFSGEQGDALRQKHTALELLVRRVSEHNRDNEALVQSALKNVTGAMDAIKSSLQEKSTYERRGSVQSGASSSGKLVSREA